MISSINISKAYSEVYSFINALGIYYIDKLPTNVYNTIKENRDLSYNPKFQRNKKLESGIISSEALSLIAALNLQYWCNDEKTKEELKKIYIDNTKKEEEKYSASNLFKNKLHEEVKEEKKALVEYKSENFIKRLVNRIINFIKKFN